MKKIKYYLDTIIFNFKFADDDPLKKEITKMLFMNLLSIGAAIFISDEVLREINRAPEPKKSQLETLLREIKPQLLTVDLESEILANRYIKEGIIPDKYRGDALHIATAVVNDIDALISWSFEHIVKLKTRIEVNGVNKLLAYHDIEICSPEEVVEL